MCKQKKKIKSFFSTFCSQVDMKTATYMLFYFDNYRDLQHLAIVDSRLQHKLNIKEIRKKNALA